MERITFDAALVMGPAKARELLRHHAAVAASPAGDRERLERCYTKAEGCRLWDEQGQAYLDFAHGDVLNLGHNPPQVLEAVRRVEERPALLHTGLSPVGAALLQNLAAVTPEPLSRTILTSSGAEAVEMAVALAHAATGRPVVVTCHTSYVACRTFEGMVLASGAAGGAAAAHDPVQPPTPGWKTVPYGDPEALEAALAPGDVAAFIIEPLQGASGVIVPPAGYLRAAEGLCRQGGTLLIVNEVDTGLGRPGSLLACQAGRIEPDILCLGPSLSAGVEPLGAAVTTEAVWRKSAGNLRMARSQPAISGATTRAAAAALATIETIAEEGLAQRAAELGAYFLARLGALQAQYPAVLKAARGRGLVIGLEFHESQHRAPRFPFGASGRPAQESAASLVATELFLRHRILTRVAPGNPNVLRLDPPLTVTREEIDQVIDALAQVLAGPSSPLGIAVRSARSALSGLLHRRGT